MTPTELNQNRQHELQERQLGMRCLDPEGIARHFAKAAALRALIAAASRPHLVSGVSGTKGSCPQRPA